MKADSLDFQEAPKSVPLYLVRRPAMALNHLMEKIAMRDVTKAIYRLSLLFIVQLKSL